MARNTSLACQTHAHGQFVGLSTGTTFLFQCLIMTQSTPLQAITPTEKAYRLSHRASVHGSILHDASYHTFIELKGPMNVLISILNMCCDAEGPGPGSQRYSFSCFF